ncbi:TonB-dependent receptor plug domain-containing protein [Emcibacter sp.]|uniref:TonB-dependent receptor plug domain-containing protein n=1 Tax=Emcibacter sp. TaxID=1979954 RepID=UPI003A8ED4E7
MQSRFNNNLRTKFNNNLKISVSTLVLSALTASLPLTAVAQDQAGTDEEFLEEVVVTGSRIRRSSLETPTPVTIIGADDIAASGNPNLGDFLTELPQLGSTFTTANSTRFIGTSGGSYLDLRRQGSVRTLVLIDGRRHVGSSAGDTRVDINTIPSDLIESVEVITGGASAIYGADAVTGVVNFILRDDFEGVKVSGQYGHVGEGDHYSYNTSVTAGGNFANDRGNAVINVEYAKQSRMKATDRDFSAKRVRLVNNLDNDDATDGIPDQIYVENAGLFFISKGGVSFSFGEPFGHIFDPDGTLRVLDIGTYHGSSECSDCDFLDLVETSDLLPELKRLAVNAKINYELTDFADFFLEGKFVRTQAYYLGQPAFDQGSIVIERDNAYLTDQLATLMDDLTIDSFSMYRFNVDAGRRGEDNERTTIRLVTGFEGELDNGMNYEVSYTYGRSKQNLLALNNRINSRWYAAIDAVVDPGTGAIVCRSTLEGSDNPLLEGCIPTSVFGDGAVNQASADWFNNDSLREDTIEQHVASAYITGEAIDPLGAGPIGWAAGVEWREESSRSVPAFEDRAGLTFGNALQITDGSYNVKEVFGEVTVPLLKDMEFAKSLSLDAAIRYADYSTTGSSTSWKVGGTYAPIDDIRFRVTYAKAVRAPNIGELFDPQNQNFFSVDDPCRESQLDLIADSAVRANRAANCAALGVPGGFDSNYDEATLSGLSGGNPDLMQEEAKTWTVGAVFTPSFLEGFSLTVDWWDMRIENFIGVVTAQDILDRCVDAESIDNIYCPQITRDGSGEITNIEQVALNISASEASGIDFDAIYRFDVGDDQSISVRLLGTYLIKNQFFPFQDEPDNADREDGEIGDPEWLITLNATYYNGPFSVNYRMRFIDDTLRIDWDEFEASPELQAPLYTGSASYHDIQARYQIDDDYEVYAGVNNIFAKNPPFPLSGTGGDSGIYDNKGRFFYAGFSANF